MVFAMSEPAFISKKAFEEACKQLDKSFETLQRSSPIKHKLELDKKVRILLYFFSHNKF